MRFILICGMFLGFVSVACTEEGDGLLGLDGFDLGPGTGPSVSELSEEGIVGSWRRVGSDDFVTYSNGGTISYTNSDGSESGNVGRWVLEGNIFIESYSQSGTDDGQQYEQNESGAYTIAIVNDILYDDVFVRVDGSGDSLDGTWVHTDIDRDWGYVGSDDWDMSESVTIQLVVEGANGDLIEDGWYYWLSPPHEPHEETDHEEDSCTLEVVGDIVSASCEDDNNDFSVQRISENVLANGYFEYGYFAIDEWSVFYRVEE